MPVPTLPDELDVQQTDISAEERIDERLARLEVRTEEGNREGRRIGLRFVIFAVVGLAISLVTLLAVVAKLDSSSTTTKASAPSPATAAAKPAAKPAAVPAARVGVTLGEYTVASNSAVGRAGRVTFAVRNAGAIPHEFVVLRTSKPAGGLLKGAEADEAGNVGEIGDVQPGQAKTVTLPLKPGHYALICNLPGHYKAGQRTDFNVVK